MIDESVHRELRKEYNPDHSQLRTLQLQMLDILIEFDRICKKYNIRYWLDAGTLLGAVRHGGFVPWDDDLDVCMFPNDYKKLQKACKEELRHPYKWREINTKENNFSFWAKIINEDVVVRRQVRNPDRVIEQNIWLDIFIVEEGSAKTKQYIEKIYGKCLRRTNKQLFDGKVNYCIACLLLPFVKLFISILRGWNKVFHKNEFIYIYGTPFCPKHYKEYTFPLSVIEFEGKLFRCPGNPHGYLTTFYGDYLTIPPKEKRVTHEFIFDKSTDERDVQKVL